MVKDHLVVIPHPPTVAPDGPVRHGGRVRVLGHHRRPLLLRLLNLMLLHGLFLVLSLDVVSLRDFVRCLSEG